MRKLPPLESSNSIVDIHTDLPSLHQVFRYKIHVVTPIFGGGVQAAEVDVNHPIRISSIRGQLRFWWRATRGAIFDNAYDLRKREVEIFGDTEHPSNVKVWVEHVGEFNKASYTVEGGSKDNRSQKQSEPQELPYPLYLFQQKIGTTKDYLEGSYFTLCIQLPLLGSINNTDAETMNDLQIDIKSALWAWINFGGIGARTRRGGGSLYCEDFSPNDDDCSSFTRFFAWFDLAIQKKYRLSFLAKSPTREWPTLSTDIRVGINSTSANENTESWKTVIHSYSSFRKRSNLKSNGKAGRSHWPEADSIRDLLNSAHPKHAKPLHFSRTNSKKQVKGFPRAQFGLPIIFQFRPVKESVEKYIVNNNYLKKISREPYRTKLTIKGKDRLSSPLLLKSMAFSEEKGISLIAFLHQPPITNLILKVEEGSKKNTTYLVRMNMDQMNYVNSPLINKNDSKQLFESAIQAFLNSEEVKEFCQHPNNRKS
ncbi:type III-B CRISPR module RAMP protein Cmr1 [Paenibacillus sp. WLX2291]|uniref:type III-B CRISPR module RAMP protein Cmr1 n=1 Tax=Paenibacillus sp. WLX2291 TaxID=3296934 RepID=UPI0039846137